LSGEAVFVALGGNVGEVFSNLAKAVRLVDRLPRTRVTKVSGLYRTPPVGGPINADGTPAQADFLNGAIELHTDLVPDELLDALQEIEAELGRVRTVRDGPRTVDLDLLLWGDRIMTGERLTIPHPRMHLRAFVLTPLAEIAPAAAHPLLGETMAGLLKALRPVKGIEPLGQSFNPLEREG